jgi:hypothetical protein
VGGATGGIEGEEQAPRVATNSQASPRLPFHRHFAPPPPPPPQNPRALTIVHGVDSRHIPPTEVSVKGVGGIKCLPHGDDGRHIPPTDVSVEGAGVIKRFLHAGDSGRVPPTKVSVEGVGVPKCTSHVGDSGRVPPTDVSVVRRRRGWIGDPQNCGGVKVVVVQGGACESDEGVGEEECVNAQA